MLKVISGANARWSDADHKTITLDLETLELGTIPFTASVDGPEGHVVDVYNRAVNGDFGPIAEPDVLSLAGLRATAKASVDANGLLLHHLDGRLSRREALGPWRRRITHWVRHHAS